MVEEDALKAWFFREILPLEAALTRFIRRNWRVEAEIPDLRQEIYARVYESAKERLPLQAKPFLFTVARNHLINSARRERIVSFEVVADLESLNVAIDTMTPERYVTAREELRRLKAGLDKLPPRCREVIMLRKIEGLSQRQVAVRMGVGETTVEHQMVHGMRALVDYMLGGSGKIKRSAGRPAAGKTGKAAKS
jgi:RNA polymerase sigma-70 factor (ECF subfamily)